MNENQPEDTRQKIDQLCVADLTVVEPLPENTDTADLEESIKAVGLIHPVVVTPSGKVVVGRRRILAYSRLGIKRIPVQVVESVSDAAKAARMQLDENNCRRQPKPSEIVTESRKVEAAFVEEAKANQSATGKAAAAKLHGRPEPAEKVEGKGRVRDRVGEAFGVSGPTLDRAKEVVEAASAEPDTMGDLVKKMDEEGVRNAHDEMRQRKGRGPSAKGGKGKAKEPANAEAPVVAADRLGNQLPNHLRDVFTDTLLGDLGADVANAIAAFDPAKMARDITAKVKAYPWLLAPQLMAYVREAQQQLQLASDLIENAIPHAVCPKCEGKRCEECRQSGYVPEWKLKDINDNGMEAVPDGDNVG